MNNQYHNYLLKHLVPNKYWWDKMMNMRYTLKDFQAEYPDDDACLEAVFQDRFGHIKDCPKCGVVNTRFYRVKKRQCYACMYCGYQVSPLADTIFHKTYVPSLNVAKALVTL